MNTCHLCNPAHNEPFRSFVEGTTTYVCVPDGAECQLYADVDAPGQLKIESAGEEIASQPVDENKRLFPLTGLLRFDLPWKPPSSLLTSLVTRLSERMKRVTDFTVTITQRLGGPAVAATYNFKLLNPADFEAALTASQLKRHQPRPHEETFAIDLPRRDEPGRQCCWNCNEPISGSPCQNCAAEQE